MSNIKSSYDPFGQITEDESILEKNLINFPFLNSIQDSFKKYKDNLENESKKVRRLFTFVNYRNDVCPNKTCHYYNYCSPICTECFLHLNSIGYSSIDNNLFYFSQTSPHPYLSKDDLNYLVNLFFPDSMIVNAYTPKQNNTAHKYALPDNSTNTTKKRKPTIDELTVLIRIHREFIKNNGIIKSLPALIFHSRAYQVIAYQLSKTFFHIGKTAHIISPSTSWEKQFKKELTEFHQYLLQNFHISPAIIPNLHSEFLLTSRACESQIQFVPLKVFSKLTDRMYAISNGNPLIIKQLAIMLAKIFIGRRYLKEIDPSNQLNHLTMIISDNPKYIREFLMDILTYAPVPSNLDYSNPTSLRIPAQRVLPSKYFYQKKDNSFYHVTEHSSTFLCNKNNIPELIKEKLLGNILNIDTGNTSIEGGTFSKLLIGTAISCPCDSIINDKLTYRSNSHYVKICKTPNDIRFKGTDKIPYDTIICSGNLNEYHYIPLDAYELFFLVTGFLNYGISHMGQDLTSEKGTNTTRYITNQDDTIAKFIEEFYIDTFDIKKANHSQKDDYNDFVDADDEMYPKYKEWFNIVYKDIPACNTTKFKQRLRALYQDRTSGKDLKSLNKTDLRKELAHRYLKNHQTDHRGVSGLKLDEIRFEKFLEKSQNHDTDDSKLAFEKFMQKIYEEYSLYNI